MRMWWHVIHPVTKILVTRGTPQTRLMEELAARREDLKSAAAAASRMRMERDALAAQRLAVSSE